MYLSYLLGGRVDFGDLQIYFNEKKVTREDLFRMGWNRKLFQLSGEY